MVKSKLMRLIIRLVKCTSAAVSSSASVADIPDEQEQANDRTWPSRTSSTRTVLSEHNTNSNNSNNHQSSHNTNKSNSSSSFEVLTRGPTPEFTPNQSKESNSSTSSKCSSKCSIPALKEAVANGAIVFSYKELNRATNDFSFSNKIGNSVYRGTTGNGLDLAVAIHKKGDAYTGLVQKLKALCSVHHSNVISMIGAYAADVGDYVYAVYPFYDGAKLRDCIRSAHSPDFSVLDTWNRRLQVAVDVAKGLEYLHEGANVPLVHKYIKTSNILVDSKTLRAKIAQFGVADLAGEVPPGQDVFSRTDSSAIYSLSPRDMAMVGVRVEDSWSAMGSRSRLSRSRSRKLTGTRGYMAPEYINAGAVTTKLDVFAFGVVLLELLSGQEAMVYRPDPTGNANTLRRFTLFEAIRTIMEDEDPKARLRQWIDPLLKDSYPLILALRVAKLAKACVETNPSLRPEMRSVAFDLSRFLMSSERWEANMRASKDFMSGTMEAR